MKKMKYLLPGALIMLPSLRLRTLVIMNIYQTGGIKALI